MYMNKGYNTTLSDTVMAGIQVSRDHIGSVEPLTLIFMDQQKNESAYDDVVAEWCKPFGLGSTCDPGEERRAMAMRGDSDASNSLVAYPCDEPYSQYIQYPVVQFINVIGTDLPYFATRGTHEYTHTYQTTTLPGMNPSWLAEGSAEYNAYHEGPKAALNVTGSTTSTDLLRTAGDVGFVPMMVDYSLKRNIQGIDCPDDDPTCGILVQERRQGTTWSIRDQFEPCAMTDPAVKECSYGRELWYDMGAWAVAYLIHLSGRPETDLWSVFFPSLPTLGYEKAIAQYAQLDSLDAFYDQFDMFIRQNDTDKIVSILDGQMPTYM